MKLEKIICFIDEAILFPKLFWVPLLVTRIGKYFTLVFKESNYLFSPFLAHRSRLS